MNKTDSTHLGGPSMDSVISLCGSYRYTLSRPAMAPLTTQPGWKPLAFCMLNPSTADAQSDDPTIRRCRYFAERWAEQHGTAGMVVVNLYALRSSDPAVLKRHADPVGPQNDQWIKSVASECSGVMVCAWGANADPLRAAHVVQMLQDAGIKLLCLGTTREGHPRHPLYVKGDTPLVEYCPPPSPHRLPCTTIKGYRSDGTPILPVPPGVLTTQAFIICADCGSPISSHGGPIHGARCVPCHRTAQPESTSP